MLAPCEFWVIMLIIITFIDHLLFAWHSSKNFSHIDSFNPHTALWSRYGYKLHLTAEKIQTKVKSLTQEHPANKVIGPDFKPRRAVPKPTFLNTNPHCLSVLNLLSHLPGEPGFITLSGRSTSIPHPTLQEPLGYFCTLYKTDLLFDSLHKMLVFGSLTTPDFNLCFHWHLCSVWHRAGVWIHATWLELAWLEHTQLIFGGAFSLPKKEVSST